MPILDDQGAEPLLAAGFTGGLASWSSRGSPPGGRASPDAQTAPLQARPCAEHRGGCDDPSRSTSQLAMDRARGALPRGPLGSDALATGPRTPG